jgi:hypothetical protein
MISVMAVSLVQVRSMEEVAEPVETVLFDTKKLSRPYLRIG